MQYTADTIKIAKTYNINERDVLFCALVAAGQDRGEAFYCIYEHGMKRNAVSTIEQARTKANDFLRDHPGCNVLISRMKKKKNLNTTEAQREANNVGEEEMRRREEMGKKLTDKSWIIESIGVESLSLSGKDRVDALMKVADLQRMKQEETREKEEVRRFYLPYVSKCRGCKVFELLRNALDGATNQETE